MIEENILNASVRSPLKVYEVMKRANISNQGSLASPFY